MGRKRKGKDNIRGIQIIIVCIIPPYNNQWSKDKTYMNQFNTSRNIIISESVKRYTLVARM